jgi:hypothetical protein
MMISLVCHILSPCHNLPVSNYLDAMLLVYTGTRCIGNYPRIECIGYLLYIQLALVCIYEGLKGILEIALLSTYTLYCT